MSYSERVFKGPDGNTYHWELGYFECTVYLIHHLSVPWLMISWRSYILAKLYRDDGTSNHTPIAKYHRRRNFWLPFIQTQDKGYFEINVTLQPSMVIDKKFTDSFSATDVEPLIRSQSSELDGDMLDLLVFTVYLCGEAAEG